MILTSSRAASLGTLVMLVGAALPVSAQVGAGLPIVAPAALERVGYAKYWETSIPFRNDPVVRVDLLDENLYLTTRDGVVHAVEADTGLLRWGQELGEPSFEGRPASLIEAQAGDGPVVFVTHGFVHVFDRFTGKPVARLKLPFAAGGGAAADEHGMYIGGADGEFYALNWNTGARCAPLVRWQVKARGAVVTTPVRKFGHIYFVSDGGGVYCVAPRDKELLWGYVTGGSAAGGLAVDDSGIYVASSDRRLYVFEPRTGANITSYLMPGPLFSAPTVVQHTLYQFCEGDGLFAFDVDSRERMWRIETGRAFVARAAENLVARSQGGDLLFVDNQTGAVKSNLPLSNDVHVATNARDNVLYMVSKDGKMMCAKPAGLPYMRREAMAKARGELGLSPAAIKAAEQDELRAAQRAGSAANGATDDPLRSRGSRP